MRRSLLFLALSTVLISIPAAKAQSVGRHSSAPAVRGPGGGMHRSGGPSRNMGARRGIRGNGFYGANQWPNFWQPPWSNWSYYRQPQFLRNRFVDRLRPGPGSVRRGRDYHSSHRQEQLPPSVLEQGKSPSAPYGMDAYAPDPTSNGIDSYGANPYTEDPYGQYEESQDERSPYYDTDPVQFSYTPADIPQRPAVVRPERKSLTATILPSQTRMPLYNLLDSRSSAFINETSPTR